MFPLSLLLCILLYKYCVRFHPAPYSLNSGKLFLILLSWNSLNLPILAWRHLWMTPQGTKLNSPNGLMSTKLFLINRTWKICIDFLMSPSSLIFLVLGLPKVQLRITCNFNSKAPWAIRSYTIVKKLPVVISSLIVKVSNDNFCLSA